VFEKNCQDVWMSKCVFVPKRFRKAGFDKGIVPGSEQDSSDQQNQQDSLTKARFRAQNSAHLEKVEKKEAQLIQRVAADASADEPDECESCHRQGFQSAKLRFWKDRRL
jgi:nitrate/TMAO reductase-like tetraheme cytochrome c subunit